MKLDLETYIAAGGLMAGGVFALLLGLFFFFAWIVQLLWNGVMVDIFPVPDIGYWQACGLYLLSNLFFKSIK